MERRLARDRVLFAQRKTLSEHPFGTRKRGMDQGYFLLKGLRKVRGEFSLTVLAYNLKRVLNVVGVPRLIEALASGLSTPLLPPKRPPGRSCRPHTPRQTAPRLGSPHRALYARSPVNPSEFSHGLSAGWAARSRLPGPGIATGVNDTTDLHRLSSDTIIDSEGKPSHQDPTQSAKNDGPRPRHLLQDANHMNEF